MNDRDESLLEFPCDFPLKIIGHSTDEFHTAATEIVGRHTTDPVEATARPSRDDKYLALSFTIRATSREQLDAIYVELSAHELVLFVL